MGDASAQLVVRQASLVDLTRITEVCLQGLPDDPTFDYLWRYRLQYPDDNNFFWQQRLKANLFDAKRVVLVAVMEESANCVAERNIPKGESLPVDDAHEDDAASLKTKQTIVAFAVWEINVKSGRLNAWQHGWFDIFHGSLPFALVFKDLILPESLVCGSALRDANVLATSFFHGILPIRCHSFFRALSMSCNLDPCGG